MTAPHGDQHRWALAMCLALSLAAVSTQTVARAQSPGATVVPAADPTTDAVPALAATRAADIVQQAGAVAPMPSFGRAMAGLPRDLWRFVSVDTAIIAGTGLGAALAVHPWDTESLEALQGDPDLQSALSAGNVYGSASVQAGGAVGTYLVGRLTGHPRVARLGLDLIRGQIVTQAWTQATKFAVGRTRPDGTPYSFPSGHVAGSATTAGLVQREFGWKAALPFHALTAYVGAARIAYNRHYLSDVVFGAAVGLSSAYSLTLEHRTYAWQISPSSVAGGIGVHVQLIHGVRAKTSTRRSAANMKGP